MTNPYAMGRLIMASMLTCASAFGQESSTSTAPVTAEEKSETPSTEEPDGSAPQAQPETAEPSVEDEAMIQFEQGREFFNQGRFEKAAIALKRAFELRPSYKILYYLGWAESETADYSRAVNAYNGYLAEAPEETEADRIAEVKGEVEKLKARIGSVRVICPVDGAKVKVDNEVMGVIPLKAPIPVDIGKHEIAVVDGPTVLLTEIIRIAGGQEIAIEAAAPKAPEDAAVVTAAQTPEDATTTAAAAPSPRSRGKKIAGIATLALAGALAVGAGVTGASALAQEREIRDRCDPDGNCYAEDYDGNFNDDQSRLRTLGITTDVLIGTAATSAVVGTVLLVLHRKGSKEISARRGIHGVAPGLTGISITGRF